MKEILIKEVDTYQEPINALITDHFIIPGIKGYKINYNKSYKNMKRINKYEESLLIFDEIKPSIYINNNYNKIILQGNSKLKRISIILKINDILLFNNLNNILVKHNVYSDILSNNSYSLKNKNYKNILSQEYYPFTNYCLSFNQKININCIKNHKYTIMGKEILSPYITNTKNILKNGLFLVYSFNQFNYKDLDLILKYLKNNNYKIISVNEMIKE